MSNKAELIDELREKTGTSWAAAARIVVTRPETVANDGTARLEGALGTLLTSLRATSPFGVQIGKVRAWGVASDEAGGAVLEMREAQIKPEWWAETGAAFQRITAREFLLLLAGGAADVSEVQVIRSRVDERGVGYAVACDGCCLFVRCGVQQREGACFCGQRYRVVFDRPDSAAILVQGRRWSGYGVLFENAAEARVLNEWQTCCETCAVEAEARP